MKILNCCDVTKVGTQKCCTKVMEILVLWNFGQALQEDPCQLNYLIRYFLYVNYMIIIEYRICWGDTKKRKHFEDSGMDGRIILK